MIWNKLYISYLLVLSTIVGCNNGKMSERLTQIDTLLVHDKVDSALNLLTNIPLQSIQNKADSAYFFLLQTETEYRKWIPARTDSAISFSTAYYEDIADNEKLARAYYYQGVLADAADSLQKAILFIKHAETIAEKTDNLILKHKVYEKLAYINGRSYEKDLSVKYAQKALSLSEKLNDKEKQAIALLYMTSAYLHLGNKDSASICAHECLTLINSMDEEDKPYLYTNLGRVYENDDPKLAKIYLIKALNIKGLPYAYETLSRIYLKEDSITKAQSLWKEALDQTKESKMSRVRSDIFKAMRQQSVEQKDFEQANALADSILERQQRFSKIQEQERILEIQAKYDKEAAEKEFWNVIKTWGLGIIALIAAIIGILSHLSYKGMKDKKELAESKIQLDAYIKKATKLENSGKATAVEINKLHEKISDLTQRHSGILAKGKELYDAIEAGGTTVRWSKNDFINYLEYFKMKDLPFVNEMETEYDHLSPKYIFFAVLEYEGKTDEDIQRIMGISESTLRSTRSRINSKRL